MEHGNNMKALFLIVNAGHSDEVIEIARGAGVRGATILNARGEGTRHELFMGITVDLEKEMLLCIADEETCNKAMDAVKEKAGIKTPAHSVGFMMPVERVIGLGEQTSDSAE